jgi:hypothetical protein
MKLGFDARIIIERPKRKAVRRRIAIKAAKKRGPADAAEASVVTWRGLVVRNQFFALNPSEIGGANTRATTKSCAMSLSTH